MSRRPVVLVVLAALLGLPACGVGAGEQAAGTTLTISEGFGREVLVDEDAPEQAGGDTVLRLLQRNAEVQTKYGGGFVQAIDGRAGGRDSGRPFDWFFYVNGVASDVGSAQVRLEEGDQVWWDRRDWGAAMGVPAVVGQFPAPFTTGIDDRRLPTRVECDDPESRACDRVVEVLVGLGIPAAKGALARNLSQETLRVVVGPWSAVRADRALRQLERGPQTTGVFARPAADGRSFALLDDRGREVSSGPAGLIAAYRTAEEPPVWTVTGTDAAQVDAVAEAFGEDGLRHRFAVAVRDAGEPAALPIAPG